MTVPRAELSAAVLNARTGVIVQRSFGNHFKKCTKLTDSQIVLDWINNEIVLDWIINDKLTLKQWVRNRIVEIKRLTEPESWRYVSISNMIADLGTRKRAKIKDISEGSLLVNGYPWMKLDEDKFPNKTDTDLKLGNDEKNHHDQECMDSGLSNE